MVTINLANN